MEESYWAVSVVECELGKFHGEVGKYLNHEVYVVRAENDTKARMQAEKMYSVDGQRNRYSPIITRVKFIGKKIETW